ncbi:MAG: hypothetical protein NTW13_06090 [Candidatus Omnitrophica bacterium]|nr:hypothetical protein [Candidatus Omnitrophota bacterium]
MQREDFPAQEHRKYIRLNTVLPVEFRLESLDGKHFLSNWIQGFTSNIGRGGICLYVNNFDQNLAKALKEGRARLSLAIELPIRRNPISARAHVAWVKDVFGSPNKYLIGLGYEEINSVQNNTLIRYAWTKKLLIPAGLGIILLLSLGLVLNSLVNIKLTQGNKALVQQLVSVIHESNFTRQSIKELNRQREDLEIEIQRLELNMHRLQLERSRLGEKSGLASAEYSQKTEEMNNLIAKLSTEKKALQEQLTSVQQKKNFVSEKLIELDKKKATLEKANLDKMYHWLKVHQNPHTGLIMSFEGDSDIKNWAFTYDQALVVQLYANFSDFERVHKLFDFFSRKAKRENGLFFNAYYANDGEPAEFIVHSGPNIWLGIAIAQYTHNTQDNEYLGVAEEIARGIMNLQKQDADGGIRGGPQVEWFATEHNLDAYAFFKMLHQVTGKDKYQEAADKTLNWLVKHTYDKADIPVKRGKGDSTIATDTYAWSIASLGPEKLAELGMDPEKIMEFAEKNCSVEVCYVRPEGQTVKIRGFDFAPEKHVSRGGVVSSEWSAQMVISFKIMADFYAKKGMLKKAESYRMKADAYLAELGNMIISSSSPSGQGEGCLPYATQDFVDTGHGWFTPKGKTTGSVSGTTYTIFAYYNYNPLKLKD